MGVNPGRLTRHSNMALLSSSVLTCVAISILLLGSQASSSPLPSNIIFPDTVVCLTSTAKPQDFQLADPNDCTVFWHCRWDGSTSLHTAVKGECSEGEIYSQGLGCIRGTYRKEVKSILFRDIKI